MTYATEITVDISDLATEDEIEDITDRIRSVLAEWKPTVTATVREY